MRQPTPTPTATPIPNPLRRTLAAGFVLAPALLMGRRALAEAPRRATPIQSAGPYYPHELPPDHDGDLLRNAQLVYNRGQAAWVEGVVTDLQGKPVRGAQVEIWQCDEAGHYHHPSDGNRADPAFQGFGRVAVDNDGRYRFRTIRPAPYSGRTPHIHVKVKLSGRTLLTTQLYVLGEPGNSRDRLWRSLGDDAARAALTVAFEPVADGLRASFPIVLGL